MTTRREYIDELVTFLSANATEVYDVQNAVPIISPEMYDSMSDRAIFVWSQGFEADEGNQNSYIRRNKVGLNIFIKSDGFVFGKDGADLLEDVLEELEPLLYEYGVLQDKPISFRFADGAMARVSDMEESLFEILIMFDYLGIAYTP